MNRGIFIMMLFICVSGCGLSQKKEDGSEKLVLAAGKGAASVEVADFNKDGKPDIAIAGTEDSSLTIYLNQGNRRFIQAEGSPFFAGHFPNDINIADINKDGNLDIILANHERKFFTVLLGNGKGQFIPASSSPVAVQVKPHTHGIITADFNNDGNLDIATDSWAVDSIVILNGDEKGNFYNPVFYSTGKHPYQRLRTADLNRDGSADIVTTNLDANTITVLLGDGNGKFTKRVFDAGIVPFGVAIGDLNNDSILDLAIVNSPTISGGKSGKDGLTILFGDGKGNFSIAQGSPFETGLGPTRVAIGDINNDGINDIAIGNINSNFVSLYFMGENRVQSTAQLPVSKGTDGLAIYDMDGDGKKDVIATSSADNNVFVFFNEAIHQKQSNR